MSDYTPVLDASAKDILATGDGNKAVLGSEMDTELALIQTALATKAEGQGTLIEIATGTFDPDSYTGFSSDPTGNLRYQVVGDGTNKWCIISDDAGAEHKGTSNGATFVIGCTSQTAFEIPADTTLVYSEPFLVLNNGVLRVGLAVINEVPDITVRLGQSQQRLSQSEWTTSGDKGMPAGWVMKFPIPQNTADD